MHTTAKAALIFAILIAASIPAAAKPALFPEKWIAGTNGAEPILQVQALDADTFVIRQSVKTNFEAPFLYLLFGTDKALLIDTGAGGLSVRPTIDALIASWLKSHNRTGIPLVVGHSHSHGDHIAGDAEFTARPDTTVVGHSAAEVAKAFGVAKWPRQPTRFDLGGRALTIIPTPGHEAAHIMVYDPRLKILLSGDALYPGRLYVPVNFLPDARASADRLAKFARTNPIRALLGAHIEMTTTAGKDYAHEAPTHADEHALELHAMMIEELQRGLHALPDGSMAPQVHDNFIIVPVPAREH